MALVGAGLASASFNNPDPIPGQVRFVGIDADPSGNTFSSVASLENTISVSPGGTFTVDIVIDEVDVSDGLAGVEGALVYDASTLRVIGIDPGSMVYVIPPADPGAAFSYNETLPSTDGRFDFSHSDLDTNTADSGEGVAARITLQCDAAATSVLSLGYWFGEPDFVLYKWIPGGVEPIPIQEQGTAMVFCGTTPTPTPIISITPSPTPICSPLPGDPDCDQIFDPNDNCPNTWNHGQENADGDGRGDVCDNCPTVSNSGQANSDADSFGNACDTCPNWTNPSQALPLVGVQPTAGDADCDGFPDPVAVAGRATETYLGTDPVVMCAATGAQNDEGGLDANPMDFNDNQIFNGQDTGQFGGIGGGFNQPVASGPFYGRPGERYDFNGNGLINGQDTGKYGGPLGYFNKVCVPSGP